MSICIGLPGLVQFYNLSLFAILLKWLDIAVLPPGYAIIKTALVQVHGLARVRIQQFRN